MLDEHVLAQADCSGDNRLDSFENLVASDSVAAIERMSSMI